MLGATDEKPDSQAEPLPIENEGQAATPDGIASPYSGGITLYLRHESAPKKNAILVLVKAGLLDEVAERAEHDAHARRRLDRFLFEDGRDDELRQRARHGDKTALYHLVRLLHTRGEHGAAMQAATDIDPADTYAAELARGPSMND